MIVVYYHRLKLVLKLLFLLFLVAFSFLSNAQDAFFESLANSAQQLSRQKYVSSKDDSEIWADIDYTQYRAIRFNPDKAIPLNNSPFEMQLFHRGFLYQQGVSVSLLNDEDDASPVNFDPELFLYEREARSLPSNLSQAMGFSGFRLHYPLNRPDYKDEFLVFQGASYFRLIGERQRYGASLRGLAVNTALPSGEEFPVFTSFWVQPQQNEHTLAIYALLDSESVTGAYRFIVDMQSVDDVVVTARIFARKTIDKLGIAPITSMFLYGENQPYKGSDYRPEVHDSDGLLVYTRNGEAIWRPLTNPGELQITSQSAKRITGFGLMQRDRDFDHYLDAEAHYQARPSLWITPLSGFGAGKVELIEIPTQSEVHDNVVAYWVSDTRFEKGDELTFSYAISALDTLASTQRAQVIRSRSGAAELPGDDTSHTQRFVVDFTLPQDRDLQNLSLHVNSTAGVVTEPVVTLVEGQPIIRATFLLTPHANSTHDMRVEVMANNSPVSEVWNYVYTSL